MATVTAVQTKIFGLKNKMATYTLTSNADTVTGSASSDTFYGIYNAISLDTFNGNDILNGVGGVDTLRINHLMNVAVTPPDVLWTGIRNIEKVEIYTTGDGAQTITTGVAFNAAFAASGVDLTTTTSGAGAINITMSSFSGPASLETTSTHGAQTIVTGSGVATVAAHSGAGALNIKGIGLISVAAVTTGAGAQTIGDNSGNGRNLIEVTATSGGGEQTIVSTSASAVKVNAKSLAGEQNITTGRGADVITAATSAGTNAITTNAGNDKITILATSVGSYTVNGGTGNDSISSGAGADTLIGAEGNDILDGGAGADSMSGGNGNDLYNVRGADDVVAEANASATTGGYDTVNSYLGAYTLGANVEYGRVMLAGSANLAGNGLNNVLYAGAGNNRLDGGIGTDTVSYRYASGPVTVSLASTLTQATGSSGSDTLLRIENLIGSGSKDTLTGNAVANVLNGGAGADRLTGSNGSDTYYVDSTGDVVIESNAVASTGGTDHVNSYLAAYTLTTNVENGRILATGTAGLTGNTLNNFIYAGAGNNIINGSSGTDSVSYLYGNNGTGVTVSLATSAAQATGGSGTDTLIGIERLYGTNYGDRLTGNGGANYLSGYAGNDRLNGGSGNDVLIGGVGRDSLTGGAGNDIFDFNALTEMSAAVSGRDIITDFFRGQDKIDLSTIDANTASVTNNSFTQFISSTTAFTAAGQLKFSGGVLYGNTDADSVAEFSIQLTGVTALNTADFVL